MKWLKEYVDSFRDIKFKKLQKNTQGIFSHFWLLWGMILSETAKNGGRIECEEDDWELLFDLIVDQTSVAELHQMLEELEAVDLIRLDEGSIIVKNWEKYQAEALSTGRVREHRKNKEQEETVSQILLQFNSITGKRYSIKTEGSRELIRGRLNEGRTVEELMAVVNDRYKKWRNDPKMEKYIRPSTIFRPGNFDNYLNEIPVKHIEAANSGELIKVRTLYGVVKEVTPEEFAQAAKGYYAKIED